MASDNPHSDALNYWGERIADLKRNEAIRLVNDQDQEGSLETALRASIRNQLSATLQCVASLRDEPADDSEETQQKVLKLANSVFLLEIQIDDYLAMNSSAQSVAGAAGAAAPTPVPPTFLAQVKTALGGLVKWLLNLLVTVTTFKGWSISGGVGSVWGLAQANLQISFGN